MDRKKGNSKVGFEEYEQRLKRSSAAISNAGLGILQSTKKPNDIASSSRQSKSKKIEAIFEHPKPPPTTRIETKENDAFESEFNKYFVQKPQNLQQSNKVSQKVLKLQNSEQLQPKSQLPDNSIASLKEMLTKETSKQNSNGASPYPGSKRNR